MEHRVGHAKETNLSVEAEKESPGKQAPVIFVIDEDGPVRDSFATLLPTMGYRARTFASADEFHRAWTDDRDTDGPDCMIVCIDLPDGDGRDLSKKVSRERPGLPVILMIRNDDGKLDTRYADCGACAVLVRPFLPGELIETLTRVLRL